MNRASGSKPSDVFNFSGKRNIVGALVLAALLVLTEFFSFGCSRNRKPPWELEHKYFLNVAQLCNAITDCIKKDIALRMKERPERRKLILRRMSRDLCRKNQFRLIGNLSVDPRAGKYSPARTNKLYGIYEQCARAVAQEKDCAKRKQMHLNHPACRRLRSPDIGR